MASLLMQTPLLFALLLCTVQLCSGARKLNSLYISRPIVLTYHNGDLLEGEIPIAIIWYGKFTPAQKSIVSDFILSLTAQQKKGLSTTTPAVSQWWKNVDKFTQMAGKKKARVVLSNQISDESYTLGKALKKSQISVLAAKSSPKSGGLALVLTSDDVTVDGFCMNSCGFHGSNPNHKSAFIWVGNSVTQCPGQCAWPFHQPIYGPQSAPLVGPNNDVGLDGMVINISSLLAGAVANPFENGYFQGPAEAPLEVGSACVGVYGKGAYPGYAGDVLVDSSTGASYNAQGVNGRKYLLPAVFDPSTSSCSTMV